MTTPSTAPPTGSGPLSDHTLDELRALDAGWGQKIPFLDEVLDLVEGRARLNIELKSPAALTPTLTLLQAAIATGRWQPDQFLLSAFDWEILLLRAPARALDPPGAAGGQGRRQRDPGDGRAPERRGCPRLALVGAGRFVGSAHARGLAVRIYPVNRQWEYDLMPGSTSTASSPTIPTAPCPGAPRRLPSGSPRLDIRPARANLVLET
jgi:hypothetical protein